MNLWFSLFLALSPAVPSQDTAAAPAAASGSGLAVYVMTMGPGAEIWERFGHIGIGVRDSSTGVDSLYDYGRFSFSDPGFLVHFLQGRMRYWMAGQEEGGMPSFIGEPIARFTSRN